MNYIDFIPMALSVIAIAIALSIRAMYIIKRTKKNLDQYHRKRGDIPHS